MRPIWLGSFFFPVSVPVLFPPRLFPVSTYFFPLWCIIIIVLTFIVVHHTTSLPPLLPTSTARSSWARRTRAVRGITRSARDCFVLWYGKRRGPPSLSARDTVSDLSISSFLSRMRPSCPLRVPASCRHLYSHILLPVYIDMLACYLLCGTRMLICFTTPHIRLYGRSPHPPLPSLLLLLPLAPSLRLHLFARSY